MAMMKSNDEQQLEVLVVMKMKWWKVILMITMKAEASIGNDDIYGRRNKTYY